MADNGVKIPISFDIDTGKVDNSIREVEKQLENLGQKSSKNAQELGIELRLQQTLQKAKELSAFLADKSNFEMPDPRGTELYNEWGSLGRQRKNLQGILQKLNPQNLSYDSALANLSGPAHGEFADATEKLKQVESAIADVKNKINSLKDENGKIPPLLDTEKLEKTQNQLQATTARLGVLSKTYNELETKQSTTRVRSFMEQQERSIAKSVQQIMKQAEADEKAAEKERERIRYFNSIEGRARRVASTMRTWYIIQRELNKATSTLQNAYNKLSGAVKKVLSGITKLHKTTNSHTSSANQGFKHLFTTVLKYGLGIRSLYFLFRKLRSVGVDAIKELVKVSDDANKSVSKVIQSFNGMKGSIATLIQPLISVFAPVLEKILNLITKIITAFGTFFALLTGQNYIYTATAGEVDYAKSLEETGKSAKKAKKELEGYLSPIDEINKYKKDDDSSSGADAGAGYTLQKTPIDTKGLLTDWTKKFLDPLKKAWAKVGEFVKEAWAGAFKSLKQLGIDIIEDFLEVWNQPKTVEMLEKILRIFGRIGTIVDILATKFDMAWKKNEIGKKILENIRDIFAIIVDHIDRAVAKTQTWAMELDFSPLLEAVENWLQSLEPLVDQIMAVFESFYTTVLLPLSTWAIEEGLPELLDVFSQLNERLANSGLSEKLQELWIHLEPFAETVGEGLIKFVEEIGNKLVDFVESDAFNNFIDKFETWMDNVTADDVVSTMWNVINALVGLKLAILGFEAISTAVTVIGTIQKFIAFFGAGTTATTAAESMTAVGGGMSALAAGFSALIGLGGGFFLGSMLKEVIFDAAKWSEAKKGADENVEALEHVHEKYKGLNGTVKMLKDAFRGFPTEIEQVTDETGKVTKTINQFGHTIIEVNDGVSVSIEHESDTVETETVKMQTAYSDTQENVSLEMKTLTKNMDDTTTSMKNSADLMKSSFSADKWTLSGVADGLAKTFNSAIERVKGIWNTFADWLNSKLQIKLDTTSMIGGGLSKVLGTSTINLGSIPKLATGAVIPPNKEFMAVLGDQKNGTNIETPLSTMIEAFNQALSQNGGSGKTEINFLLPNKQSVAQYVIEGGKVLQMSRGKNPFELA